jgi:hypothetical protein
MLTLTLRGLFGARRKEPSRGPFRATLPFGSGATPQTDLIFRMKSWPQLPEHGRTAEVYRILSVMSSQPVNRRWLIAHCRMAPHELDRLLMQLVADGALEAIDPAQFAGRQAHA